MDKLVDALVPGMPAQARAAVTARAQGLPLFAIEIIRALIDRDIVQPSGGSYRLTGAIGQLEIPGSLRALLAARLDALGPGVRELVEDAAVLGTTFSADALIAVAGQDEPAVRAGLAELLRREVLAVSADPLSPERGSYQFAQDMLRQVAYDTLSRRDRKARHLTVAAHLREAFPGDGEEVIDIIARHYLDALLAIPGAPDETGIREKAIAALTRAAERASRTGAPARAAASYATAAQLAGDHPREVQHDVGVLWESAAAAAIDAADWAGAVAYSGHARDHFLERRQTRAAARAQGGTGNALRLGGRHTEAREQLTAALQVLRAEPDGDTARVLGTLAMLEVFAGTPDADRLSAEALALGQGLDLGPGEIGRLLSIRGTYHGLAGRQPQAVAYFRAAAQHAEEAGDTALVGLVLLNTASSLATTNTTAARDAARTAAGLLRRIGNRARLGWAIENLAQAELQLGNWDSAEEHLGQAIDQDRLSDIESICWQQALLRALRGDAGPGEAMVTSFTELPASEDPQDRSLIGVLGALVAVAPRPAGQGSGARSGKRSHRPRSSASRPGT